MKANLRHHIISLRKLLIGFLVICALFNKAAAQGVDTVIVQHADVTTMQKGKDSVVLFILEGNVILKQGKTIFKCDRCVKNDAAKTFEAWGKVHINDSDTTNIYSDHLRYLTDRQIAFLDGNVKLTDGKAVLTTPSLEYNMGRKIATYDKGGKLVNKKTVITSKEGFYYSDIKDAYFKRDVVVEDPAYHITADSLMYNTDRQIASFISPTNIRDSANRTIKTREGFYNLRTGDAEFSQRPFINDNNKTTLFADNVKLTTDIARAEGNAIVVDSTRGTIVIGNLIYQDRHSEALLATQKPVMIIKQDNDSIYVSADTLFSAKLTDLYVPQPVHKSDSLSNAFNSDSLGTQAHGKSAGNDSLLAAAKLKPEPGDSLLAKKPAMAMPDSTVRKPAVPKQAPQTENREVVRAGRKPAEPKQAPQPDNRKVVRTGRKPALITPPAEKAGESRAAPVDSLPLVGKTAAETKPEKTADNDSTNRYFEAFHHVKIYSDSVQAVSDSLFYSFKDSVFRFFHNPVVWGKESQITGDTLYLHTSNKQPKWFEAINNAMMVNHLEKEAYNQIKSSRMDGYFTNGSLDSVRAKGSAESIYFLQDEDSAYSGINQSTSDIIDAYIHDRALKKVIFRSNVKGTIYPIRKKRPAEMRLEGFKWLEALRPKSKFDIFE